MKWEDFMKFFVDVMFPWVIVILVVSLVVLSVYAGILIFGGVKEQEAAEQHCIDAHNNTCEYYGCRAEVDDGGEYAISMRLAEQNCLLREARR